MMKKNKIDIYQADFVFMLGNHAHEFDNSIIWKWGKIKKKKYNSKYGYIYRCEFKSINEGVDCLIECMNNRIYAIAVNQKVKKVRT